MDSSDRGGIRSLSEENSSDIVRGGPRAEEPLGEPASDEMLSRRVDAVTTESRCSSRTIHRPSDSVPSCAALADTASRLLTQKQLERYQSLHETQKLLIKSLQDELGEEAEFFPEEDPKMRRV